MKLLLQKIQQKSSPTKNYWLPKLHKNLIKARFIIAATTSACTIILNQVNVYNKLCSYFSGVNSFWTILNNQPVINALNKWSRNGRGKTTSISCFEFSTLHAKIPYDAILNIFTELIVFYFKGGDGEFRFVDGHGAKKTKKRRSEEVDFAKSTLKKAVKYILQKKVWESIFRQIIGTATSAKCFD